MLNNKDKRHQDNTLFYEVVRSERKAVAIGKRTKADRKLANQQVQRALVAGVEYL